MKNMKYHQLSEKALSRGMAMLGFVLWLVGVVWHGLLGNPSMMTYMYPWFNYSNAVHAAALGVVWVVAFFVIGWLVAVLYNMNLKKK